MLSSNSNVKTQYRLCNHLHTFFEALLQLLFGQIQIHNTCIFPQYLLHFLMTPIVNFLAGATTSHAYLIGPSCIGLPEWAQ